MILNDGQVPAITDFRVLIKYEIYKAYLSKGNRIRIFLGLVSPLFLMLIFWLGNRHASVAQLDSNTLTNAIFNLASSSLLIAKWVRVLRIGFKQQPPHLDSVQNWSCNTLWVAGDSNC